MKKSFLGMILVLSAVTHWSCGNNNASPTAPPPSGPSDTYPFLFSIGESGAGNGQFNQAWGMAVRLGEIYVADTANNRVQIFGLDGTYLEQFPAASPVGIAIDKNNV